MKLISIKCPYCNADLTIDRNRKSLFCEYCGGKIIIDDEVDRTEHTENINITHRQIDEARLKEAEVRLKEAEMVERREIRKQKRNVARIIGIVVFLALICLTASFLIPLKKVNSSSSLSTPIPVPIQNTEHTNSPLYTPVQTTIPVNNPPSTPVQQEIAVQEGGHGFAELTDNSEEIVSVRDSGYKVVNGYLHYAFIARNKLTDKAIQLPQFRITSKNALCEIISTQTQILNIIYPDQEVAFASLGGTVDDQPAFIEVEFVAPTDDWHIIDPNLLGQHRTNSTVKTLFTE